MLIGKNSGVPTSQTREMDSGEGGGAILGSKGTLTHGGVRAPQQRVAGELFGEPKHTQCENATLVCMEDSFNPLTPKRTLVPLSLKFQFYFKKGSSKKFPTGVEPMNR